jgi:hypothetical protein
MGTANMLSPSSGQDCSSLGMPRVAADLKRIAMTDAAIISCGWKAGRRRTTGSAISATEDELWTRLRALLVHSRSMRARVGRRPAVFRRTAFRSRHVALAREFYKPTSALISESVGGDEKHIHSKAEVLLSQLKAMSERKLTAMLSVIDGVRNDDACAADGACAMRGITQRFTRGGLGFGRMRADRFSSIGCRYVVTI